MVHWTQRSLDVEVTINIRQITGTSDKSLHQTATVHNDECKQWKASLGNLTGAEKTKHASIWGASK